MSNIHDQAMHYIYQQVLQRLLDHMTQAQRASVQLLVQRLLVAAGGLEYIGGFRLLMLHGSDPRSARLLAILRAAQLSIALRGPETFRLRVVIGSQPALREEILREHDRAFSALFLHDDPRVQLLMLKAGQVLPFTVRGDETEGCAPAEREALLLFGHLTGGRPEALLGSRLHLELADAYGRLLAWDGGDSALVTAMPERQRRRFLAWSRASLRVVGYGGLHGAQPCVGTLCASLGRLRALAAAPLERPEPVTQVSENTPTLRLIPLDDLLQPINEGERLLQMLGHSDTALGGGAALATFFDPTPLAHLQALRARLLQGKDEGLCSQLWQEQARALFEQGYGIGDTQLVCLLFTPFVDRGRGLGHFVQRCHPNMRVALPYLHRALQGKPCPEAVLRWLIETSGLNLAQLRALYLGRVAQPALQLLKALARRDSRLSLLAQRPLCVEAKDRTAI
ncbi:hypothetical protein P0Y43_02170 [Pseudomonas entomophila]|uniref:hypothetical protein n=1 Tax=Pseudomonas entomophila TaxID=312306 RepID=UPI0023D891C1|nr:hypothetical protein [Pseudomonas entomophila]MDF0729532.1 hypothetical protein [Pseudomonas entomophila]